MARMQGAELLGFGAQPEATTALGAQQSEVSRVLIATSGPGL